VEIKITEEEFEEIQKKVLEYKMSELFHEPSTYEDELDFLDHHD
jgi:hypothetical protein